MVAKDQIGQLIPIHKSAHIGVYEMVRMAADKVDNLFTQRKNWVGYISWCVRKTLETDAVYYVCSHDYYIMENGSALIVSSTLDVLEGYVEEEDVLLEEGIAARVLPKGSFHIYRAMPGFRTQSGHLLESIKDGKERIIRADEMIACLDGGVINTSTL